ADGYLVAQARDGDGDLLDSFEVYFATDFAGETLADQLMARDVPTLAAAQAMAGKHHAENFKPHQLEWDKDDDRWIAQTPDGDSFEIFFNDSGEAVLELNGGEYWSGADIGAARAAAQELVDRAGAGETGGQLYERLARELGSQHAASD